MADKKVIVLAKLGGIKKDKMWANVGGILRDKKVIVRAKLGV